MKPIALILFGTPGSGKGQQAELLADSLGLIHVDTGKLLRAILSDPEQLKDAANRKEKKLNDAGILNTPSWVVDVLSKKLNTIVSAGYGIVFSGSPRTLYEAERIIPLLEKLYGKKGIHVFFLKVPLAIAAKRNRERYICSVCRRALLTAFYPSTHPKHCPVCAGALIRRIDDDPKKFATRTKEYIERTQPAINYVRRRGYKVEEINGTPAPFKVFRAITSRLTTKN